MPNQVKLIPHPGVVAPNYQALYDAASDGKITQAEVAKAIVPHQAHLESDAAYRATVEKFLDKGSSVTVTKGARIAIADLLDLTAKKPLMHFQPKVESVKYNRAGGIQPPGMMVGLPTPSITIRADLGQAGARPIIKVRVNEQQKLITVVLDAVANTVNRELSKVQDYEAPLSRPKKVGAEYRIVVRDRAGHELAKTTFRNTMPA